jgi:hypothetical protein
MRWHSGLSNNFSVLGHSGSKLKLSNDVGIHPDLRRGPWWVLIGGYSHQGHRRCKYSESGLRSVTTAHEEG